MPLHVARLNCETIQTLCRQDSRPTVAFSCGARSAFELKEQDYLRNMLSRRQLQGFVMLPVDEITYPVYGTG